MGEKEQGAAREASSPSLSERKSGSVIMRDRAAEGHLAGGDPDFDTARASNLPSDLDDDGDGSLDDSRVAILKTKTKSNQSNDRLGGEGVPDGSGAAKTGPIRIDSTPARVSEGDGNDIAIGDPGVNGN